MNKRRLIIIIASVFAVAAVAAGVIYFVPGIALPGGLSNEARISAAARGNTTGRMVLSGFIEVEEIELAPELGGRVTGLPFDEGDEVEEGDTVLTLATSLLDAQRKAMQAQLDIAKAQRDLLASGVTDEDIATAEAQVALAQASVDAAQESLNAAWMVRNNPQDVEVQIAEVNAQIEAAQHQVNAAGANLRSAQMKQDSYEITARQIEQTEKQYGEQPNLYIPLELATAPQELEAAASQLDDAQNSFNRANELLTSLQNLAEDPQQAQSQVISAQTALNTAEADLNRAQAQLESLKAGATDEQLESAGSRIEEAEAALASIETQIDRMALTSPTSGVVLDQTLHVGELAAPGVTALTLADLDTVELTVYIPAGDLDRVELNQEVSVQVDAFPRETFEGTISYISDEAEFTPSGVQTPEERVSLVYAVKIRLPNPDHQLKPGMPADVTIR